MGSKKIVSPASTATANKLRINSSGKPERGGCHRATVSEKLEALKSLVPSGRNNVESAMKPDQLFQETAEYIVLLRTQVLVLQKLIDFYGGQQLKENRNSVQ